MKCNGCKNDFDKSKLMHARNENGERAKTGMYYCAACESIEFQRKLLVDYLHKGFIHYGYYKDSNIDNSNANKNARNRLMGMINKQIQNLKNEGYSYEQIRIIVDFMITKERVEFSDTILGLVPYYYMRTSKFHNELFKIGSRKTFGYIEPSLVDMSNVPAHKPNKKALRLTDISQL